MTKVLSVNQIDVSGKGNKVGLEGDAESDRVGEYMMKNKIYLIR